MDNGNWRPTQGVSGGPVGMESGDWRAQLQVDSRQRIVNKIMETLKRHLPFSGHEGLQVLNKIAVRFEEKMYTAATSQSDYLRKISLKMLTMETGSQNPMPDPMQANSGLNPTDPGSQVMPQVNIQGQQLPIPVPSQSGQQQMMSQNMQNNIGSTGMQGSSSLSAALPTQGVSGGPVGDPSMESGDWRAQLQADSRLRIVNKIMETLKRHLPFSGHEGLLELYKIAMRFEAKIYTAATSQSDYLRKISLKMLTMEARSQNPMPDPMQANSGLNPTDPGSQVMPQVNIQGQQLPIPVPYQSGQQQMMPQNMQNNIGSTGMQGYSSL